MSDEYYVQTSAYAFAIVLAHEALLVSTGTYAKIRTDNELSPGGFRTTTVVLPALLGHVLGPISSSTQIFQLSSRPPGSHRVMG